MELVTFRLGEALYCLPISQVREVVPIQEVTHLPGAPSHMAGAVELRGRVIPVLDLGRRLGMECSVDPKYIVIAERGEDLCGILIGDISEVIRVSEDMVVPPPDGTGSLVERVVRREGSMALVLDVHSLMDRMQEIAAG